MGYISGIMKVMNEKSNSNRFPTELNVLMFERSFCDVHAGEGRQNNGRNQDFE